MPASRESFHEVPGVGQVLLVRRKGIRRLSVRLKPLEPVRCLAPAHVSVEEALQFVATQRDWIQRHRRRIDKVEERRTTFDETTEFRTRFHTLKIVNGGSDKPVARISGRSILIAVPTVRSFDAAGTQELIRKAIEHALRKEAAAVLPYRLSTLAREAGLTYSGVTLRAQKTRWGSCSAANRISLNVHLMRLPDEIVDYVLLHELAHTRHKNHGRQFWSFLDVLTNGKARELDRRLNGYSPTIY